MTVDIPAPHLTLLSEASFGADTQTDGQEARFERGWMILDVMGMIRFCNTGLAHIIGCAASDLVGKPAKAVLPDIALREGTPGYNVALARVDNSWQAMDLMQADGTRRPMDARVDHHLTGDGHLFFVELHIRS